MKNVDRNDAFIRKRIERQRRIRKRRMIVALIIFIILLLATGVVLSLTVFFPVECIKVSGSEKYTYDQLVAACGINDKDNLFMVSQTQVEDSLKSVLPYVDKVKIKRQLPGTVLITVSDAKEYACFNISGKFYAVSESWQVLAGYDKKPEALMEVRAEGIKCSIGKQAEFTGEKTKELINTMLTSTKAQKLNINYIDITDEINLTIKTEGRFIVNFGTSNNIGNKIMHLAGMLKNIDKNKTGKINLSMWSDGNTEGTFVEEKIN